MPIEDFFKGEKNQWQNLFDSIEELVNVYPDSRGRIVNYFLKGIRSSVDSDGKHLYITRQVLEIISNIYSLNIEHKSTNYFIAINIKLANRIKNLEKNFKLYLQPTSTHRK